MASSESYSLARQIVDMLAINDFTGANALLLGLVPQEIAEVGKKSIALGADPQLVAQLVSFAGSQEVIEIVDNKPTTGAISMRPWWHYLLGALVVGGGGYAAYRKWGKR